MSNSLITCSLVAKDALAILQNQLGFAKNVNRDWESTFPENQSRGYSPGTTLAIKKPPRYTYRAGRVSVPQATTETTVNLTLSQGGADLNFTGLDRTLLLQQYDQKIEAAVVAVCNEIDRQGLEMAHQTVFNAVGTVGTPPATQAQALAAVTAVNQRLDEMGAPRDKNRTLVNGPLMNAALIQGFAGLFNSSSQINKQYGSGLMVDALGISYALDQNVQQHTNGTQNVAGTNINGAGQTGSTITVVGLGGTITAGTIITLPGVNAVNPQSRTSTGNLAQFVVTANAAAAATSLSISPAIVTTGPFQNVTASPTTGQPFVILGSASGSYNCNVGYHRDAFTLAMVPMFAPPAGKGVIDVSQMSDDGLNVKVTQFYDGVNDNYIMRLDVLFGWAATYPELACKLVS